jgi:endonuclease/exonuclease/phosphatase family metal-dependent hydrolase
VDADRVAVVAASGHAFTANLGPAAPGVVLIRGYVMADVVANDRLFTIVSAHPESGDHPAIAQLRGLQAADLVAAVSGKPTVVLMGDLNDVPGSPLHQVLVGGGLVDAWAAMRPGAAGYTAPHPYDLSNKLPDFLRRIDYVFVRGLEGPSGKLQGSITLFGAHPSDRVDGALGTIWPSDHAAVIAGLLVPR